LEGSRWIETTIEKKWRIGRHRRLTRPCGRHEIAYLRRVGLKTRHIERGHSSAMGERAGELEEIRTSCRIFGRRNGERPDSIVAILKYVNRDGAVWIAGSGGAA
jgi:hypothetical protein